MNVCPCGLNTPYEQCCGLYIDSGLPAPTPVSLMRSRYCAYAIGNIEYIGKTMKGQAAKGFDLQATKHWSDQVEWLSLEVTSEKMKTPTVGFVIFEARYRQHGQIINMREKSEFHLIDEQWYYVAGKTLNPHKGIS